MNIKMQRLEHEKGILNQVESQRSVLVVAESDVPYQYLHCCLCVCEFESSWGFLG